MIELTLACEAWPDPVRLSSGAAVMVGRDDKVADIPLRVSGVSKHHCEIAVSQTGAVVRDLGSTNGTFVNGRWISESQLHDGDVLDIGPNVQVRVTVTRGDGPLRCDRCDEVLTADEGHRGGRYRDANGQVYCLRCALEGHGDFPKFGAYRLLHSVGQGLTGRVFEARDTRCERGQGRVALKVLNPTGGSDEQAMRTTKRFQREIELTQALAHPAIVAYHDSGEVAGQAYMAMEFVDGADLGQLMSRQERPFTPQELAPILETVASALEFAHGQGVVHRDIKPGNVLRDDATGAYKVTDFGLARRTDSNSLLTSAGSIVGTLEFMAPEQLADARIIDGRADVYGLAATAYYLVSGQRPFAAANDYQLMMLVMSAQAPALATVWDACPPALSVLLGSAMQRDPDQRLTLPGELARRWREISG